MMMISDLFLSLFFCLVVDLAAVVGCFWWLCFFFFFSGDCGGNNFSGCC